MSPIGYKELHPGHLNNARLCQDEPVFVDKNWHFIHRAKNFEVFGLIGSYFRLSGNQVTNRHQSSSSERRKKCKLKLHDCSNDVFTGNLQKIDTEFLISKLFYHCDDPDKTSI